MSLTLFLPFLRKGISNYQKYILYILDKEVNKNILSKVAHGLVLNKNNIKYCVIMIILLIYFFFVLVLLLYYIDTFKLHF